MPPMKRRKLSVMDQGSLDLRQTGTRPRACSVRGKASPSLKIRKRRRAD